MLAIHRGERLADALIRTRELLDQPTPLPLELEHPRIRWIGPRGLLRLDLVDQLSPIAFRLADALFASSSRRRASCSFCSGV